MYEFAKVNESTRVQMKAITQHEDTSELHAVRSRKKPSFFKKPQQEPEKNTDSKGDKKSFKKPFKFKPKGCFRCGGNHGRSAECPAKFAKCKYCGKQGHVLKVCLKRNQRVHQIGTSDGTSETIGATNNDVFLGTLAPEKNLILETLPLTVHSVLSYAKRIYAFITLNGQRRMKLKVDTGADICTVNIDDLQDFPFPVNIKKDDSILKGYGPGTIKNIGVTDLKVTFRNKSINTEFNVVYAPGKPSVIGCAQAQELGIITVNIDEIESNDNPAKQAAAQGKLTKELILKEYKAELEKMQAEDIIVLITEPTEWVNSIVCNVTERPDGSRKARLCIDLQDLNKNIKREHYYSKTIDEILPLLQGATKISKLTKELILKEYNDCFDKVGRFPGEKYHIQLIDNPVPVIHALKTVPVYILPLYKAELEKIHAEDIIVPVTEPTEWVNSIVCNVTEKPDGSRKARLCIDPQGLNKNIKREHYYSKTIDEILPLLHGATKISAGDTNKGYWYIELDYESSLLCTFNTLFGRFRPKRLPFGVKVSQDIFQRKLDEILRDVTS